MVTHFTVTLNGSAQALSSFTTVPASVALLKQIIFHADTANTHVVYVGGRGADGVSPTLTSSNFGFRLEVPVATVPPAPTFVEAINTSLGDWQMLGTAGEKVHVTAITQ